jgi:excisionase family DNA binding protein
MLQMTDEHKSNEPLMNAEEVGEYLGLTKGTIYQKVSKGEIPFLKLGHTVRFRRSEIDQWIEKQNAARVSA